MKPKITLLELRTLQRDVTEENAGRVAVHVEYISRHDPCFKTWRGLCDMVAILAYAKPSQRKSQLLDSLMVMEWEVRKRTRQRFKN